MEKETRLAGTVPKTQANRHRETGVEVEEALAAVPGGRCRQGKQSRDLASPSEVPTESLGHALPPLYSSRRRAGGSAVVRLLQSALAARKSLVRWGIGLTLRDVGQNRHCAERSAGDVGVKSRVNTLSKLNPLAEPSARLSSVGGGARKSSQSAGSNLTVLMFLVLRSGMTIRNQPTHVFFLRFF